MANNGSSSCVDVIARALAAKAMNRALVTPISAPTEKELVGVGTGNEQIMFKVGGGLAIEGTTSPFTLVSASSGAIVETKEITPVSSSSSIHEIGEISKEGYVPVMAAVTTYNTDRVCAFFTPSDDVGTYYLYVIGTKSITLSAGSFARIVWIPYSET